MKRDDNCHDAKNAGIGPKTMADRRGAVKHQSLFAPLPDKEEDKSALKKERLGITLLRPLARSYYSGPRTAIRASNAGSRKAPYS